MSVRPYIWFEKFLVFVFLSVHVCDAITVAEIIRFAWNLAQMCMCYTKLALVFAVHFLNSACTQKYLSALQYGGEALKSVLTWLLCLKFMHVTRMLCRIVYQMGYICRNCECTVGQKNETPLFISIQIIVQKWNWYQSSWISVYFSLML